MRTRTLLLTVALLLALAPSTVGAQQATPSPPLVKWGKWALLGGAVTMNLLAADAHEQANDVFDEIEARCVTDETLCYADGAGNYADDQTEALYQQTLGHDRRARGWLIGGQGALIGAAALFIWEFTRPQSLPENIPFEPEVDIGARETRVGVNLRF